VYIYIWGLVAAGIVMIVGFAWIAFSWRRGKRETEKLRGASDDSLRAMDDHTLLLLAVAHLCDQYDSELADELRFRATGERQLEDKHDN